MRLGRERELSVFVMFQNWAFFTAIMPIFDCIAVLLALKVTLQPNESSRQHRIGTRIVVYSLVVIQLLQHVLGMSTEYLLFGLKFNPGADFIFPIGFSIIAGVFVAGRLAEMSHFLGLILFVNAVIIVAALVLSTFFGMHRIPTQTLKSACDFDACLLTSLGAVVLLVDLFAMAWLFVILHWAPPILRITLTIILALVVDSFLFSGVWTLFRETASWSKFLERFIPELIANALVGITTSIGIYYVLDRDEHRDALAQARRRRTWRMETKSVWDVILSTLWLKSTPLAKLPVPSITEHEGGPIQTLRITDPGAIRMIDNLHWYDGELAARRLDAYRGQWIAISNCTIVGVAPDRPGLEADVSARFGDTRDEVLIRRVPRPLKAMSATAFFNG
jgi:hypothetical protein